MAGLADSLVYFPAAELDGGTPADLGLTYEDVPLRASDGVRLHAWWVPGGESTKRAVLFLHGNGGNISHRLDKLAILRELDVAVLLLDYRGYGRSEGHPSEEGTYRDADAAYEWLAKRVAAPSIVLYGESLGGPIATNVAARHRIGGLILESSPSSILDVARYHYPWFPVRLFLSVRYDALSRIGKVKAPILILHSRDDEIVPFEMSQKLLAAAPSPKRLVELRGAHNDNFIVSAATYRAALRGFVAGR